MKDPGKGIRLTSDMRDKLPAKAFGLPRERKYPMMVIRDGKTVPSLKHAYSAKGYALKGLERGYLSPTQYRKVLTKAIEIEAAVKGNRTRNPKSLRDLTPKEKAEIKEYKLRVVGDDATAALELARLLRRGINRAADYCKIKPAACKDNLGLPRSKMPQIAGGKTLSQLRRSKKPGDQAAAEAIMAAGGDPKTRGTIAQQFLARLKASGVQVRKRKIPVGMLKATQREIQAAKAAGMADVHLRGDFPKIDAAVLGSEDGHILDGHHRWAALTMIDPFREMEVIVVDLPIKELLYEAAATPGVYLADFAGIPLPNPDQRAYKRKHPTRLKRGTAPRSRSRRAPTERQKQNTRAAIRALAGV